MPTVKNKKSKKQVILEAAARLFRDKGYPATSMRDLAQAVDLKASSLYNHIASKEEILQKICFDNARHFLSAMKKIEKKDSSATDRIKDLLRFHIQLATEDPTSVTSFNDEWRHLSEPQLTEFKTLRKDYENRFKAIIKEGIKTGEFNALNSTVVLYSLLSSIRWLYDWYHPDGKITTEQLVDHLLGFLLYGLIKD